MGVGLGYTNKWTGDCVVNNGQASWLFCVVRVIHIMQLLPREKVSRNLNAPNWKRGCWIKFCEMNTPHCCLHSKIYEQSKYTHIGKKLVSITFVHLNDVFAEYIKINSFKKIKVHLLYLSVHDLTKYILWFTNQNSNKPSDIGAYILDDKTSYYKYVFIKADLYEMCCC